MDSAAGALQRRVVTEKGVGIVLHSFKEIVEGVRQMLEPARLAEFRRNVAALDNRAIFEIPEILAKLLGESAATTDHSSASSAVQPAHSQTLA
jgi:hypothetical protein